MRWQYERSSAEDGARTTSAPHPERPLPDRLHILVVAGASRGQSCELGERPLLVGSDPCCDLRLDDAAVSRRHLRLALHPHFVEARDLGSKNGSYFAGARFAEVRLGAGACITLGQSKLRLVTPETAAAWLRDDAAAGPLHGRSGAITAVNAMVRALAGSDAPVLVTGEAGTGKSHTARALHDASPRRRGPFVHVDLRGMPAQDMQSRLFGTGAPAPGVGGSEASLLTGTSGGTLFLHEVAAMPNEVQLALLTAIESGLACDGIRPDAPEVTVRLIASTSVDLAQQVHRSLFNRRLYRVLTIGQLHLPALRQRPEDIPVLATKFLTAAAAAPPLPEALMESLLSYDWPGNVAELRQFIERMLALGEAGRDLAECLDEGWPRPSPSPGASLDVSVPFRVAKAHVVDAWERDYLAALLESCQGNIAAAARHAGIDRVHLYRLINKHGLTHRRMTTVTR